VHEKLREEGVNEAWGLGTSHVEPCEVAVDMTEIRPNAAPVAAATHCSAMNKLYTFDAGMPGEEDRHRDWRAEQFRSSGWRQPLRVRTGIAGKFLAKVQRIKALCQNFKVSIKAAALHFSLAHPASAAIIPGASKPERIAEDHVASR